MAFPKGCVSLLLVAVLGACGTTGGGGGGGTANASTPPTLGWALAVGGTGYTIGVGVEALPDGTSVLVGSYDSPITLAAGTPQETVLLPGPDTSGFLARHDATGLLLWAERIVGSSYVTLWSSAALEDGAVAVTGFFAGSATFGEGGPTETTLLSPGLEAGFVAVYEPTGLLRYARRIFGPAGYTETLAVAAFPDGGLVLTGLFEDVVTLGEGDPLETTLFAFGDLAGYVARYAADGTVRWARAIEAADGFATGWAVAATGGSGVVVAGQWQGTVTVGLGEPDETTIPGVGGDDLWIARFTENGDFLWARAVQGAGNDEVSALSGNGSEEVRLLGYFDDATVVGGGAAPPVALTSNGHVDGFLAAYDAAGNPRFALRLGGPNDDFLYRGDLLSDGSTLLTGAIRGEATMGEGGGGVGLFVGNPADPSDAILVARYGFLGDVQWATVAGGPGADLGVALDVGPASALYVTGGFVGTAVFGAGQPNETVLTGGGLLDAFLVRLD